MEKNKYFIKRLKFKKKNMKQTVVLTKKLIKRKNIVKQKNIKKTRVYFVL